MKAPEGYEFTGEFRVPDHEWYLDTDYATPTPVYAGSGLDAPYPILRNVGPTHIRWKRSDGGGGVTWSPDPAAPPGWRIVGRGPIKEGEFFMSAGDRRVWRCESGIYHDLFALKVEPLVPRPTTAPWFTLTNQYRVPQVGEWFLAKGGFGSSPVALEGDPVKLAEGDVPPSGPRWILELHT